ncbi:hypothetical protein NL676_004308 [Syzygium grande]|nr:hypothetical protein NL676_004308 [Syzygium grande]
MEASSPAIKSTPGDMKTDKGRRSGARGISLANMSPDERRDGQDDEPGPMAIHSHAMANFRRNRSYTPLPLPLFQGQNASLARPAL